jgi:hypothetical protein
MASVITILDFLLYATKIVLIYVDIDYFTKWEYTFVNCRWAAFHRSFYAVLPEAKCVVKAESMISG